MSITEIKQRIARMSADERDDIMAYLNLLDQKDDYQTSPELIEELNERLANHESHKELAKPWREVVVHVKS